MILSGLFLDPIRCRRLTVRRDRGCRCASWCDLLLCSPAIFETPFSYDKDIWIPATDYYMHFYIIVLFPLTAILQLINFTAS